jgi:hypothetical protein
MGEILPFNAPTTVAIFGPTMSGKTHFVMKLIKNSKIMFVEPPEKIMYCYSAWQDNFEKLETDGVEFHQGLPSLSTIEEWSGKKHTLLILDDLAQALVDSKDVQHFVTVSCHHKKISVIWLMQNIYQQGKCARTISLNCQYIVLMNNKRDLNQINTLGRQIFPGKPNHLVDSYKKAMALKPYNHLLIDLDPRSDVRFQLRTRIFPDQTPTIVYTYRDK